MSFAGDAVSGSAVRASAWAPLRIGAFRAMYLAVQVSNVGTWMQTVGAQWLLVNQAEAAILVPLVQVMDTAQCRSVAVSQPEERRRNAGRARDDCRRQDAIGLSVHR